MTNKKQLYAKIFLFFIFFVLVSFWVFRNVSDQCELREILRKKNSLFRLDAVVLEKDCGALNSNQYIFSITSDGQTPNDSDKIAVLDHLEKFEVDWQEPKILRISYGKARIREFKNYYYPREMSSEDDYIVIRETQNNR